MAPVETDSLTETQQRVLDELTREGIAIVPFGELIGDDALWQELRADMDAFVEHTEQQLASGEREQRKQKDKYLVRRFPRGKSKVPTVDATLPSDGCWLRFAAHDRLLDVVNAYRGGHTKLVDFDQWYTLPAGKSERIASQRWHRDPEDQHVVKVFLYFSDVDEESGPFEYVRQSAAGRAYGDLWAWGDSDVRYPPTDELERAIPSEYRVLATGPAGTIVVCDTSGFHRGGYGSKPRILETHTYVMKDVPPGSKRRKFVVDWRDGDLSPQARFALG